MLMQPLRTPGLGQPVTVVLAQLCGTGKASAAALVLQSRKPRLREAGAADSPGSACSPRPLRRAHQEGAAGVSLLVRCPPEGECRGRGAFFPLLPSPPQHSLSPLGRKGGFSGCPVFCGSPTPGTSTLQHCRESLKCFLNGILGRNAITRIGRNQISCPGSHVSPVNGRRHMASSDPTSPSGLSFRASRTVPEQEVRTPREAGWTFVEDPLGTPPR